MKPQKKKKMRFIQEFENFNFATAPAKPKTKPKTKPGTRPGTRPSINPDSDPMRGPRPSVNPGTKARKKLKELVDKEFPMASIEDVIAKYNELMKAKKQ
jgi:hypothetical protein